MNCESSFFPLSHPQYHLPVASGGVSTQLCCLAHRDSSAYAAVPHGQARDWAGSGDGQGGHRLKFCGNLRGKTNCIFIWFYRKRTGEKMPSYMCSVRSVRVHWVLRLTGFWLPPPPPAFQGATGVLHEGDEMGDMGDPGVGHAPTARPLAAEQSWGAAAGPVHKPGMVLKPGTPTGAKVGPR